MSAAAGSRVRHHGSAEDRASIGRRASARALWPLWTLLLLACALRFVTLGHQSLWYDEAYTPVHVLHGGLGDTLKAMVHSENSPPLWYILIWLWSRVLGTGAVALRSLSAVAGVLTVGVVWLIGRELGGRRTALVLAAIVAVNPLFVWYSQEARAYALLTLFGALSLLFFVRAWQAVRSRGLAWWALTSILALATHYFAVFLVAPEALALAALAVPGLRRRLGRLRASADEEIAVRPIAIALAAVTGAAFALVPLLAAQGGHGTQWIGRWALSSRLVAIPGYFLLGGQSTAFGYALLGLCALPLLLSVGLLPGLSAREWRAVTLVLSIGAMSLALPLLLAVAGADYLAPRNVIASWLPLAAALAVLLSGSRSGRIGITLAALICAAGLAIVLVTDLTPRYERGDWQGVSRALSADVPGRAVVTVELGAAPLEYYNPGLRFLRPGHSVQVSEIDAVGYRPLRRGATRPPTPAFRLASRRTVHGLVVLRFSASSPQSFSERALRDRRVTAARSEVLIGADVRVAPGGLGTSSRTAGQPVP